MPELLAAMTGSWRGALSALRSPWGHREDAAPSPRPQALARTPLSDKNPAPRPVGREALLQQGTWAWFMTAPPFWPCCDHCWAWSAALTTGGQVGPGQGGCDHRLVWSPERGLRAQQLHGNAWASYLVSSDFCGSGGGPAVGGLPLGDTCMGTRVTGKNSRCLETGLHPFPLFGQFLLGRHVSRPGYSHGGYSNTGALLF